MAKVFISYSRKDIDFAKRLTAELQKSKLDFWIDWEGIPPTVDWWREIEKGIEEADAFVFIISPDSANSKVCGQEVDHAVQNGKRLIPLVIRETKGDEVHPKLSPLNWIFFREEDDFDASVTKLLTSIHTDFDWVETQRCLQVKALEWERNYKENSFLLRGKDLQDAELQLATNSSKEPIQTPLQRNYVFESRKVSDMQRRITTWISIGGIIALAILAAYGLRQARLATENAAESQNNAATAQANLIVAQTAQVDAQNKQTLADNNAATAIANEQEAIRQAQIALARQLASQAQSSYFTRNSNQMFASLLNVQSLKLHPNTDASNFLINNNLSARPISHFTYNDQVLSAAFRPFGIYVVTGIWDEKSGSWDNTVRVWHADSGHEFSHITHDDAIQSVAFSPDGIYIVSGSWDNTVRVWKVVDGQEAIRFTHDNLVLSVSFSPDGKYVVSGSQDNTARVWEIASGQEVTRLTHDNPVYSVAFSPDGKFVVTGSWDTARVWEVDRGREVARLTHDNTAVQSVTFSPNGKYVVSGSWDNKARVWEVASEQEVAYMTHDGIIQTVAFSPDGKSGFALDWESWEL